MDRCEIHRSHAMNPNDFVDLQTFYLVTPSGHSLCSLVFFFCLFVFATALFY